MTVTERPLADIDPMVVAKSIGGVLNDEAPEARRTGVLTSKAVQTLIDSRIILMLAPREYGGQELSIPAYMATLAELTRLDGPSGWVTMTTSAHAGLLGAFLPQEGADELFAGDDYPRLPGMSAAVGRADRVEGGYIVTGKWQFASGSTIATGFIGGAAVFVDGEAQMHGGAPQSILAYLPRDQVTEKGNWSVDGLEPTQSIDYEVTELFVPEKFTILTNPAPAKILRGAAGLAIGMADMAYSVHGAEVMGFTQRLLDEIATLAPKRGRAPGQSVADNPLFKHEFAARALEATSVRNEYFRLLEEHEAYVAERGGPVAWEMTQRLAAHVAYMHEVGMRCADLAFSWAGSAAFRDNSAIGRFYRDINVARQHAFADRNNIAQVADALMKSYSSALTADLAAASSTDQG
ncbi:acyl-CoA dehydrogenase family protein [Alloalcanivorax gelatiniphagus]